MLDRHLVPFFAEQPLERIDTDRVAAYMAAKRREGLATKTVHNHLNFLHGVFAYAVKRRLGRRPTRWPPSTGRGRRGPTPTSASSTAEAWRRCCARCPTTCSGRPNGRST